MKFRVDLDVFRGPLDLLLYLVRKHEVDITNLPIALVTEQYLRYLEILETLDVNAVGDFLEMASTLIEIKSRLVLPRSDEVDDPIDDPRHELVRRLLQYKDFKDAASLLEQRSRQWQQHFPRRESDLPARRLDPALQPIHEVELWDLVSALGRIIRAKEATRPSSIVYDETPIQTYMQRIHARLVKDRRIAFTEMFTSRMHKSAVIGIFLAILELVRHHQVRAEQNQMHGEIWLLPSDGFSETLATEASESYEHPKAPEDEVPVGG